MRTALTLAKEEGVADLEVVQLGIDLSFFSISSNYLTSFVLDDTLMDLTDSLSGAITRCE